MPWKQRAKQAPRPLLQRFGQKGMVGIRQSMLGNVPCRIPFHGVLVHQQADQFSNGDGRVGVVHLNSKVAMQLGQWPVLGSLNAENVLQAARDEEELLGEAKLFALHVFVIWIKDLRDVLGRHLFSDRADEIALIESPEVEAFDRARGPQSHSVYSIGPVSQNRRIVWNPAY